MKPVLQALVLAERIYEDKTGKKIIAGTFNGLLVGTVEPKQIESPDGSKRRIVPGGTDVGCPSLYISVTDVVDGTELRVEMSDVSKNAVLFGTTFKIKQTDRLATVEIIAPLPPIAHYVRGAGVFSFDLIWQGEILGSHRLIVKEIESPTRPTQQEEGEK